MRVLVLVALSALVIVGGCGRVPGSPTPAGDYKLYEAASTSSSQQLSVIDSRSHSVELNMPLGAPSPDWTHLYTIKGRTLVDLDPQTGTTLHSLGLPGNFQLPPATLSGMPGGLSQDGRWLVLESFDATSNSLPSATHMLVVDTSYAKAPRRIDLKGSFNFDAISNDGQRVYMIENLPSSQYYVRFFDLGAGRLDPTIVFDKSDSSAAMAGLRLSGVPSSNGDWLYSVYVRPDKGAFLHILSLDSPIAFCIDLPGSGYNTNADEFHWSLALSAGGSRLYAANGAMGVVAEVNTGQNGPALLRTVHIASGPAATGGMFVQNAEAKEIGANGAVLSPDGETLVMTGKTGLVWLDTASLKVHDQQLSEWTVWSLAISPDGTNVYAVNDTGMIAELPMAGSHTAITFSGAPGQPLSLVRVAAAPGS